MNKWFCFCSKAVILIYDTKCNHGFLRVNSINYVIIKSRICIIKDSVVNISCKYIFEDTIYYSNG